MNRNGNETAMKRIILILAVLFLHASAGLCVYAHSAEISFVEGGSESTQLHLGAFSAKAELDGCSGKKLSLITAIYSGAKLEYVEYESFVPDMDIFSYEGNELEIDAGMLNPHAKAFVWENSMCPLAKAEASVYCTDGGKAVSKEIHTALSRFDDICTPDVLEWLASLYDPEIGGFYYSLSARDYEGFLPDLESTSQVLTLMRESGMIPHGTLADDAFLPAIRDKIGGFARELQSEADGYFYHPQWGTDISVSRRERDLSWARAILSTCGMKPKYLLPAERLSEASLMSFTNYTDEAEFEAYLNSLDFTTGEKAYASANELASSVNTIKSAGMMAKTIEFLKSKQDPNTGLWGYPGEVSRNAVNAAMKASSYFCASTGEEYPYFDKMVDSVIYTVENESPNTASALWNPAILWEHAIDSLGGSADNGDSIKKIEQFLPTLINSICDDAMLFKKSDGGFSYYKDKSIKTSQGTEVSLGLAEGDVNATLLCTERIRNSCYALAGIEYDKYFEKYKDGFFNLLANAQPIVKKERLSDSFEENFDSMQLGASADNWTITGKGTASVAAFPNGGSNSICVTNSGNGNVKAKRPLFLIEEYETLSYEFDLCLVNSTDTDKYERWSIYLGEYGAEFIADGKNRDDYVIYWRTASTPSSSLGTKVCTFAPDTMYKIKIIYTPSDTSGKRIQLFVDGSLIYETDEYYDMSSDPMTKIDNIIFYAWGDTCGKLYADNISITLS